MRAKVGWRTWALCTSGAILAGVGVAGYLRLRGLLPGTWPAVVELLAITALLISGVVALAVWATRRHYQRCLHSLSAHVAALRDHPSPQEPWQPQPDLEPLYSQLESLAARYRQTLTMLARQSEALNAPRANSGPADAEEGRSRFTEDRTDLSPKDRFSQRLIARLDAQLHWLSATPSLQRLLGQDSTQLHNHSFLDVVHEEDSLPLLRRFQEALDSGEAHQVVFRIRTRAGAERHVHMDVLTRYNDAGRPLLLRCHLIDTTDRTRGEQEFRRRAKDYFLLSNQLRRVSEDFDRLKESYSELYHSAPVLYFSLDPEGNLRACNDMMLQKLGYPREELIGQPYLLLLPPESRQHYLQNPAIYQQASKVETRWAAKDGRILDVLIANAPSLDAEGRFVRSRSAAQDVTERNRLALALQVREQELEQLRLQVQSRNGEPAAPPECADDPTSARLI